MSGIQKAKERGVLFGPHAKLNKQQITEIQQTRISNLFRVINIACFPKSSSGGTVKGHTIYVL